MIAGAATAAGMTALSVKSVLGLSTFPLLMTISFVYAAAYLALAVWLPLLDECERLAITGWLHSWTVRPVKTEEYPG